MPIVILSYVLRIFPQLVIVKNHGKVSPPFIHLSYYQFSGQNYIVILFGKKNLLAFVHNNCHVDIFPYIKLPVVLAHQQQID